MDGNTDDFEAVDATAAAEYLKKLDEDHKRLVLSSGEGADSMDYDGARSILDQIASKKKTLSFTENFMKLNIEDLKTCQYCSDGGTQPPCWTFVVNDTLSLQLRLVWLQGDVIYDFPDFFMLQDMPNSACKVIKTPTTAMSSNWLAPGVYCSVMGQLQEAGDNPVVVALKLTDMRDNDTEVVKAMWPLEIHQLKFSLSRGDNIECVSSKSSSSSCSCSSVCSCSKSESHSD